MAEVMGPGVDDARAWEERLGWAYGLIAADPAERDAAQERLAAARRHTVVLGGEGAALELDRRVLRGLARGQRAVG
ncbi:hypothetical protein ABZS63_41650, partial [Streptomyces sp. NPDC005568]